MGREQEIPVCEADQEPRDDRPQGKQEKANQRRRKKEIGQNNLVDAPTPAVG
jgi:hypothetical protein